MPRVLLVFLDGVGLGDDDPAYNPFLTAALPVLHALAGGAPLAQRSTPLHAPAASLVGIDATLGMAGIPQSGTGQAALFTGVNAAEQFGRHFGPWVPAQLRPLVREQNVLVRAQALGCSVTFANAYPEEVVLADAASAPLPADAAARRRRRSGASFLRAGPPLAALGAGVLTRHTAALARGDAIASEITHEGWREHLQRAVPVIDARTAGHNLARIAAAHDLTLFAHYSTDYVGHRCDADESRRALERVDAFIGGILDGLPADVLLLVTSDHGNIEDLRVGHTRNPAIGLVVGQEHKTWSRRLHALTDVTPVILDALAASRLR